MADEQRLERLERCLQRLEDEQAVTRLIASYGPLADAGDADAVAALWAEDGEYDVEGWQMRGRDDLRAMIRSDHHQNLITGGACHFLGPVHVTVDGDEAVAVCDSILVRHRAGVFDILRAGANHFRLRRFADGWRIARRTTRLLDGAAGARGLLASGMHGRPV